jgi:hypothetical protein
MLAWLKPTPYFLRGWSRILAPDSVDCANPSKKKKKRPPLEAEDPYRKSVIFIAVCRARRREEFVLFTVAIGTDFPGPLLHVIKH